MKIRASLIAAAFLCALSACSTEAQPIIPDPAPSDGAPVRDPNAPAGQPGGQAGSSPRVDLGNQTAGTPITFDVPAGTIGFTIVVDAAVTQDDFVGVAELRNPSGELVLQDFRDAKDGKGRSVTGPGGAGIGVTTVPLVGDHAADPVPAGKWTVRLGGSTRVPDAPKGTTTAWSGPVHGVALFQTSNDGAFHGGAIDLDLYVPDGLRIYDNEASHAITAASAAADAGLKARLDIVFGLFNRLYGLDRGDVRFHPIASSVASLSGQGDVDAANVLASAVNAHPSAQVILTNELRPDGEDGGEISGISNCLPGAMGVPATKCSAIIVSLRATAAPWEDAATLVHELGHFAGLEHTTEFDGGGDTLSDTSECTNLAKAALASCPDHDNLMFPSVNSATGEPSITVSPTQRAVLRASTLYRASR